MYWMITLPRNCQIWLPGYLRERMKARGRAPAKRVWLTLTDHFEPLWNGADEELGGERVAEWTRKWPEIASRFEDSTGRPPRYTFFYPEEEYRPQYFKPLERLVEDGISDVEIHLHHDGEGQQDFVDRMSSFAETLLHRHGMLRVHEGKIAFGFIHGNWALDNSMPDGSKCGLNNEITLLRELGCYADFTMPSAGSPTQARTVNTIYWAIDDPEKPKSYDSGIPVLPGSTATGDLLMIPGPLGIDWRSQRFRPRMENGEIASYNPPTAVRVERWLELAPRIGEDVFVKLHTHGTQERHSRVLLNGGLDSLFSLMIQECKRVGCELHFASAWEMRKAVDAAQQGSAASLDFLEESPARHA
jgi:hypothetical protein